MGVGVEECAPVMSSNLSTLLAAMLERGGDGIN